MTDTMHPSFTDVLALAEQQQQLQMWRAAQLVTSRVTVKHGRADVLECLGLTDVVRPDGA